MPQPPRRREEPQAPVGAAGAGAAGAAGAGAAAAPAGAALSAQAIRATTGATIRALRAFWGSGNDDIFWLYQQLKKRYPAEPEDDLKELAQKEADYGFEFRRRMALRLERDVPTALSSADPKAGLRQLLEREKRYIRQRQRAMISRSISTLERASLKRTSPYGAYWRLSPFVKEHTIDCLVMGGKFWPWEVLDHIYPPRHANCPCELLGLTEAINLGLLPSGFTPPPPEGAIALANDLKERYAELREALEGKAGEKFESTTAELEFLIDGMENERMALQEAGYDKRFAKGTVKGGEYMPKLGGYADKVKTDLSSAVNNLLSVGKGRGRGSMRRHGGLAHVPQRAPAEPKKPKGDSVLAPHVKLPGGFGPSPHTPVTPHEGGSPPKTFEEFRGRVDAGAAELAEHYGAKRVFVGIQVNPQEPDTTALRHWNGQSEIGGEAPKHLESAAIAQEGEADPVAASGAWLTYSRAAHEVAHGVNPIMPAEYQTPEGYAMEEALAEEFGRDTGAKWLAADGHTHALEFAAANPSHPRIMGAYTTERARLGAVLEEAKVPEDQRRALLETLAFRQSHPARMNILGGLLAANTGISSGEGQERVRATLTGERDGELGIDHVPEEHLPLLKAGEAISAPKTGEQPTETGGAPDEPVAAPEGPQSEPEPVTLKKGTGPRFFDARHYSDPRRSMLQKMKALPDGETLELADGSTVKRGPKGSFRVSQPGNEKGKLYSTPQRLVNAETAGVLERHGITDDRLTAAKGLPGAPGEEPQQAPAEDAALNDSLAAKPAAEVLGIPHYDAEETGLHDFKPAGGSNGAQFATDKDGQKWLVKGYKGNTDRVATEALANSIYRELGVDVPNAGLMEHDGGTALAYPAREGNTERWRGESQELGEGFMADALLANWDVVGLEQDNVLWDDQGNPIRLDQGGTLEYRAMGQTKPFGPVPTEAWTMRGPKGQAFGRMETNDQMLKDQAGDIAARLTPEKIDSLVDATPFKDEEMRERVSQNLKARVDFMGKIASGKEELPGPLKGQEADRQLSTDAGKLGPLYPEEENALEHLVNGTDINDHLRSGGPKENADVPVQGSVELLDGLLHQARTSEDLNVYMPVSLEALGVAGEDVHGKRFREKGFLEASTDEGAARAAGKAVLRVLAPAGSHAFPLGDLSTEPGAVVFSRGSQVRIAGVSNVDGQVYIDAVLS